MQLMPASEGREEGREGRGGRRGGRKGGEGGEGNQTQLPMLVLPPPPPTDSLSRVDLCLNVALPAVLAVGVATGGTRHEFLVPFSTDWARLLATQEGEAHMRRRWGIHVREAGNTRGTQEGGGAYT